MTSLTVTAWMCVLTLMITRKACLGGSVLQFTSTPMIIKHDLTRRVTMRCELAVNYGRMSSTDREVDHVTSYTVTGSDEEYVAMVSKNEPVRGFIDEGNLHVEGSMEGTGFIQLTWHAPATMTLGHYTCALKGRSKRNRLVRLEKHLYVSSQAPSMADLLERVNNNEQDRKDEVKTLVSGEVKKLEGKLEEAEKKLQEAYNKLELVANNQVSTTSCPTSPYTVFKVALPFGLTTLNGNETVVYPLFIFEFGDLHHSYNTSSGIFTTHTPGIYAFKIRAMVKEPNQRVLLNFRVKYPLSDSPFPFGTLVATNQDNMYYTTGYSRIVRKMRSGWQVWVETDGGPEWPEHTMYQDPTFTYEMNTFSAELLSPDCQP